MTRTPDRSAPSPGRCLSRREDSRSSRERDCNSPRQAARRSPIRLPGPSARSGRSGRTRRSWTSWRVSSVSRDRPAKESAASPPCPSRRETIADSLAECPPGGWVAVDELFRYMQATGDDFAGEPRCWACTSASNSTDRWGMTASPASSATRYLLALLLEYARDAGMIDVALIPPAGARRRFSNCGVPTNSLFSAVTTV